MAIVWNQERMTTGVDVIDREHQELIRRFNEFHDAMAHGQGRDAASRLLSFIVDYTETHFAHEEKCMAELRCPAAAANLAAHNALRRDVAEIKTHLKADGLPLVDLVKIERTLGDWLQRHICSIDVKLRECVRR
ncbi:bacteriohemerythrin [Paludisphaera rhizosphaerae]|uniref:bacteriohemerythrin n=1 Tax=Paludisphaera rhizosphaerae TaxID=2711216 RepID=UPI0013EB4286|nr:bacteriohemerythrin [Paludisphaera rhizosphaerae]